MLYLTALSAALTAALVAYVLSLATPVSSRDFFAPGTHQPGDFEPCRIP